MRDESRPSVPGGCEIKTHLACPSGHDLGSHKTFRTDVKVAKALYTRCLIGSSYGNTRSHLHSITNVAMHTTSKTSSRLNA
jgi:hypothetical protein